MAERDSKPSVVDVCTKIQPLKHQSLSWQFVNFEFFINTQVNLVTQKFGPFFDDSLELLLALHNDGREVSTQMGRFTLSVEVKQLKGTRMKRMNLCGQMKIRAWSNNFFIELNDSDKGSISFEFPTSLLTADTLLDIQMQYVSKQFQRHFVLNQKGNNTLIKNNVKDKKTVHQQSKDFGTLPIKSKNGSETMSIKSTKTSETLTSSFAQQTDPIQRISNRQLKKNTKWTNTELDEPPEPNLMVKANKSVDMETHVEIKDDLSGVDSVQKQMKNKYAVTAKPTKNKEQQTEPIKPQKQQNTQSQKSVNLPKPSLISTSKKPTTKNASTDTVKSQKHKWQRTDQLSSNSTNPQNSAKNPTLTNPTSPPGSKDSSKKTKWQQTENFLYLNLSSELDQALCRHVKDPNLKAKVEDFIQKMAKMWRLREVNCVLSPESREGMADEFVKKLVKLIDVQEGNYKVQEDNNKDRQVDVQKDQNKVKETNVKLEEQELKFGNNQKDIKAENKINGKLDTQKEEKLDSSFPSPISQSPEFPYSFSLKNGNSGSRPLQPYIYFIDQTKSLHHVDSKQQLIQRIHEAREEIAASNEHPNEENGKIDEKGRELNRMVHEIATYMCMNDVDPVKLALYERKLRDLSFHIDLQSTHRQQIMSTQLNLHTHLTPWRIFLDYLKAIPMVHQNCTELLDTLSEMKEADRDEIKTLEDIDLQLKETHDKIFCARCSCPHLTSHARRHILSLEDEQSKLELNCSQLLTRLRFQYKCYPSAGPWLSPQYINGRQEGIAHGSNSNNWFSHQNGHVFFK